MTFLKSLQLEVLLHSQLPIVLPVPLNVRQSLRQLVGDRMITPLVQKQPFLKGELRLLDS